MFITLSDISCITPTLCCCVHKTVLHQLYYSQHFTPYLQYVGSGCGFLLPSFQCKAISLITIQLQCSTADSQSHNTTDRSAFCQPITRYLTLCCYRVSRLGLLNAQRRRRVSSSGYGNVVGYGKIEK